MLRLKRMHELQSCMIEIEFNFICIPDVWTTLIFCPSVLFLALSAGHLMCHINFLPSFSLSPCTFLAVTKYLAG